MRLYTRGEYERAGNHFAYQQFRECIAGIAETTGTKADITYTNNYPGIVNDDAAADHVLGSAHRLYGEDMVHIIEEPTMTTEDFGEYLTQIPGAYFHIGAGSDKPLHNPEFLPGESVSCRLAEVLAGITEDYLK